MVNSPNVYDELLKRLTRRLREAEVDRQILEKLQEIFESELDQEPSMLSRPQRVRLFKEVAKTILTDVMEKVDNSS